MQGIRFLVDNQGCKTAALIDLREHGELWAAMTEEYNHPSGIQFLTDNQGHKTEVLINFKEHGELWEDIYDSLIAESRVDEPRDSFAEVEQMLREQVKLSG